MKLEGVIMVARLKQLTKDLIYHSRVMSPIAQGLAYFVWLSHSRDTLLKLQFNVVVQLYGLGQEEVWLDNKEDDRGQMEYNCGIVGGLAQVEWVRK